MGFPITVYRPIRITLLLLFGDERNYMKFAPSVWAAMIEAEQFFGSAGLLTECRRLACLPGASPALSDQLPRHESAGLGSDTANSFWQGVRAPYSRTYDQKRIASAVRESYILDGSTHIFIATDQEIRPPKDWRYILWEGIEPDVVISTAPMDPEYWGERSQNPGQALKHRFRTALLNAIGETIGIDRCKHEQCLQYGNIDGVDRLDVMIKFGGEHGIPALTDRGFDPESNDPGQPQPLILNPGQSAPEGSHA